jgi:hypothetical protein
MDNCSLTQLIERALEMLCKLKKCQDSEEIIEAIKKCLVLALKVSNPSYDDLLLPVKIEPEENAAVYVNEQQYQEDSCQEFKYEFQEQEFAETEIKTEIEDTQKPNVEELKMFDYKRKVIPKISKIRKEVNIKIKADLANTDVVLLDCQLCDRKRMTKRQMSRHVANVHVSLILQKFLSQNS